MEEEVDYKAAYEAAMRIIKAIFPDKFPDSYFISGGLGEVDENGLPDSIVITPAYGVDWFQIYTKTEKTYGTEW